MAAPSCTVRALRDGSVPALAPMWDFLTSWHHSMEHRFRAGVAWDNYWWLENVSSEDGRYIGSPNVMDAQLQRAYFGAYLLVRHRDTAKE